MSTPPEGSDRGGASSGPSDPHESLGPAAGEGAGVVVRRLGWLMTGWTMPGLVLFLGRGDVRAALVLTLTLGLSIVHLRSLQAQVSRLDPDAPTRAGAVMVVRWGFLIIGLLGVLSFGVSRPLALAWGVALLPVALITEAVLAAMASRS
ncbi:MAG TPA: hypothetical protein VMT85_06420 [Thermoanaerobaculia bacterium]|nr:hypothetical protein [Thermoanaerobaculia bacterium]